MLRFVRQVRQLHLFSLIIHVNHIVESSASVWIKMDVVKGSIKGLWSKYGKYGKYMILAGLVGDVVVLGAGYYGMNHYPSARLTVGQASPALLDSWYMLADRYAGQDFVVSAREADMNEAARIFLESKYAFVQTKKLWYNMKVDEQEDQW